jgi:hypothetical protein
MKWVKFFLVHPEDTQISFVRDRKHFDIHGKKSNVHIILYHCKGCF